MAAIDLAGVMDAIASLLVSTGTCTRAYGWPAEGLVVGDAVVGYPTAMEFDVTFQRGSDKAVIPFWVVAGLPQDRATRTTVSALITSATDIKDALDGNLGGACGSARVIDCVVERWDPVGLSPFVTVRFDVEVYG